jgi:uncharacterized protein involved in exopolysaccharide biosynthesis
MSESTRHEALNLQMLTRVVRQRAGVILMTVMIFAMLGVLINTLTPPVYRATTRIEIRRTDGSNNFQSENVSMYTAAALITNRALLGQIVDEFDARGWIHGGSAAGEMQRQGAAWLRRAGLPIRGPAPAAPDPSRRSKQIDWLETAITVEPVRDTDREAARTIADRLTQRFSEYQTRRTTGPDSVRTDAGQAVAADGGEASRAPLPAAMAGRGWMRARLRALDGEVANTTSEYYRVRSARVDAATRLAQLERYLNDTSIDLSAAPVEDGAMAALRQALVNCQARIASVRQVYRDSHPRLSEASSECSALRASLRREMQRSIAARRAEIGMLAARENELRGTLNRSTQEMGAAEAQNQVQEQVMGTALALPAWVPPVEIVDPATLVPGPVRPRKWMNLLICVATGLMVGTGLALLRHSMRHTIRTPEDVEAELGLEVLGVIPKKTYAASW